MLDFLVSLLEANVNFQTIGAILVIYFASIWVLFCFWVFMDAKRRFDKTIVGIFFFFVVLIFNFPGLIFYLIIRPDKNEDTVFYLQNNEVVAAGSTDKQGIDVPILNFVDENGEVNLSFQLKINKSPVLTSVVSGAEVSQPQVLQVNVDVPTVSASSETTVVKKIEAPKSSEVQVIQNKDNENKGVRVKFSSFKNKFLKNSTPSDTKPAEVNTVEVAVDSNKPSTKSEVIEVPSKASEISPKKKSFFKKKKRRR